MPRFEVTALIEQDAPSADTAVTTVQAALLPHVPDLQDIYVDESLPVEDPATPDLLRHVLYVHFPVTADHPRQAAERALALLRDPPGHPEVVRLSVNGDWNPAANLL
jgi:hypothetical protein